MRVGFVVNHPTQFEVPFYQYVAKQFPHDYFEIFYLKPQENQHFDKELKQSIKWGFNLFEGYPHQFLNPQHPLLHFKEILQSSSYDLMIINGYKEKYAGFAEVCRAAEVKVGLRLDTVLFNQPFWKIWLRKLLLKKEYRKFEHYFVTGKVSKDYCLAMGIKEEKINLFSYCIDNQKFNLTHTPKSDYYLAIEKKYQPNKEQIILSVAKFVGRESPWDILRAFVLLNRKDLSLILIGDGAERKELEEFAHQYPRLKIHFTGYIPYEHLPDFYILTHTFIHAAKDEPWGVSVQEAIAGGCFVICSDKVGAAQDLLIEGKNGFTYEFGNVSQLAKYIADGLLLKQEIITQTNKDILSHWNYDLMWVEIKKAKKTNG